MARSFKIPRYYKTLLAIIVVAGPIVWLMFTDDGKRRTDMMLMWLLGRPDFDAALDAFSPALTEAKMRETFADLELACSDGPNPFGDRLCSAAIGSFNQYPAQAVIWYFAEGRLSAVKLIYQRAYHDAIRGWVERRIPDAGAGSAAGGGAAVWPAAEGVLVMKSGELGKGDEPSLLWLSPGAARAVEQPGG